MAHRSRRFSLLGLGASVVIVVAIAAVWAAASEDVRGLLMLVGGLICAVTVIGGYVIERHVHW